MIVGVNFNIYMMFCLVKVLIMGFIYCFLSIHDGEILCQKDELMAIL